MSGETPGRVPAAKSGARSCTLPGSSGFGAGIRSANGADQVSPGQRPGNPNSHGDRGLKARPNLDRAFSPLPVFHITIPGPLTQAAFARAVGPPENGPCIDPGEVQARSPHSKPERRNGGKKAFTLIEVLVAVGITALLAAFIVTIVTNVSGFWSRTSGRLSAEAQGRFILDQLTLDLQSALFRDDGGTWLAVTIPANINNTGLWTTTGSTPAALKPANVAGSLQFIATADLSDNSPLGPRFGIAGAWLRFFTTKRGGSTTLANVSAPVAVSYQIVRRATSGNEGRSTDRRYLLHRAEVRPGLANNRAGTFETGFESAPASAETVPGDAGSGSAGSSGTVGSVAVEPDASATAVAPIPGMAPGYGPAVVSVAVAPDGTVAEQGRWVASEGDDVGTDPGYVEGTIVVGDLVVARLVEYQFDGSQTTRLVLLNVDGLAEQGTVALN